MLIAMLVAGVLAASMAAVAEEARPSSPQTTFFQANGLYRQGDYAAAVDEYERLLDEGLESGQLYFNLGNAYFKLGERGKAILSYERARRFLPTDPDVHANLEYARSLTEAEACELPWWQRLLFPLAERLATGRLAVAATAVYTLLLVVLAVYRVWPRRPRWLLYIAVVLGFAVVIVGASLLRRLTLHEWRNEGVVVGSGETAARFEPAETGTVHFSLREGSEVDIVARREGWVQVARCDHRRGWMPAGAVEALFPDPPIPGP